MCVRVFVCEKEIKRFFVLYEFKAITLAMEQLPKMQQSSIISFAIR